MIELDAVSTVPADAPGRPGTRPAAPPPTPRRVYDRATWPRLASWRAVLSDGAIMRVKATREGRIGHATASGYVVDRAVPFVALPSTRALRRFVRLSNPASGRSCLAIVLDVGPWNEHDDAYVFTKVRPAAESGVDERGRATNRSGIDLSERVWIELAMRDNGEIEWEFIE